MMNIEIINVHWHAVLEANVADALSIGLSEVSHGTGSKAVEDTNLLCNRPWTHRKTVIKRFHCASESMCQSA